MIVCSCNVISDGQIRACLRSGADCPKTAAQVYRCLGCSPQCGRCARTIRSIVAATIGETHACNASCAAACPLVALAEAPLVANDVDDRRKPGDRVGAPVAPMLLAV